MVTAYIYQKLWEKGYGYIQISKSGQLLDRSLIDASVSQPERLDFAAEPVLRDGMERRSPGDIHIRGGVVSVKDITAAKTLAEWRKSSELPEARRVRETYVAKRTEELMKQGADGTQLELHKAVKTARRLQYHPSAIFN